MFAPGEPGCKQLIEEEVAAINEGRQGLEPDQMPVQEYERRFLPVMAKLEHTTEPPTTYPEYDRLYGIGDPAKTGIRAYAIFGVASHDDDPEEERFENDSGFAEFFKAINVLETKFAELRLAAESGTNPLAVPFEGATYAADSFDELFDGQQNSWLEVLEKTRVPWYFGYHDPNRAVDGELDNIYNPAVLPLSVQEGDSGGGSGGGTLFFDDMEETTNWAATGLWHATKSSSCAAPGYASAETAWYFGDDDSCTFNTSGRVFGALTSLPIAEITESSVLTFNHFRHVEQADGAYDRANVEISVAGRNSWTAVWTRDSSSVSEQAWLESEAIDLAGFAGQAIQVRFTFDSVDGYANNFVGWLIDDVKITK